MASVTSTFTTFGTAARSGSIGGSESWGTPGNVAASDDSRAQYGTNQVRPWNGYTFYLTAQELTTEVPAGATIDGIQLTIERRKSASDSTWTDSAVYVIKGGTIQTTQNKASASTYGTSDALAFYGATDDLWGVSWTAADINGSGFGFALSCAESGGSGEETSVPQVDYMQCVITYTPLATSGKHVPVKGA